MKQKNTKLWLTLLSGALVLIFALSACQPAAEQTPSPEEIAQRVALTQQAAATEAFVQTLIAKVDQLSNQPTWTPQPTYTPYPTPEPVAPDRCRGYSSHPAVQPTAPSGTKCYQMEFLGDVNYPPETAVKAGDKFVKSGKSRIPAPAPGRPILTLCLCGAIKSERTAILPMRSNPAIPTPWLLRLPRQLQPALTSATG